MAATKKQRARQTAEAARPYVGRLLEDDKLRDDIRDAYGAARKAYARATNGKAPAKVLNDKKLRKELRRAGDSLRDATERLRAEEKKRRWTRLLLIAMIGAVLAIALSEDLRKALLDRMFGAEEEFEYSSTTSPAPETTSTTG